MILKGSKIIHQKLSHLINRIIYLLVTMIIKAYNILFALRCLAVDLFIWKWENDGQHRIWEIVGTYVFLTQARCLLR